MDPRWIRLVLGDHVGRRSETDDSIPLWARLLQKAVFHLRGHHTTSRKQAVEVTRGRLDLLFVQLAADPVREHVPLARRHPLVTRLSGSAAIEIESRD